MRYWTNSVHEILKKLSAWDNEQIKCMRYWRVTGNEKSWRGYWNFAIMKRLLLKGKGNSLTRWIRFWNYEDLAKN